MDGNTPLVDLNIYRLELFISRRASAYSLSFIFSYLLLDIRTLARECWWELFFVSQVETFLFPFLSRLTDDHSLFSLLSCHLFSLTQQPFHPHGRLHEKQKVNDRYDGGNETNYFVFSYSLLFFFYMGVHSIVVAPRRAAAGFVGDVRLWIERSWGRPEDKTTVTQEGR